ncbi:Hypothetical protein SMAX5B_012583 [Scophthalmus maximus]|uniref:Uncharacterized protein n=1 Tax=Scophthalmus maximus TaxID=52904 RepID=A0A2U9B7C2_SCOMX|nr:Hypothetical protein SMAX5B_012583 [Scophthalmus maximus]
MCLMEGEGGGGIRGTWESLHISSSTRRDAPRLVVWVKFLEQLCCAAAIF